MNKNIRDVELMARAILKDEELMKTIDDIRWEEIDKNIQLGCAYQEGIENGEKKGIKQGEKENSIKIAKEMKKDNVPIEKIIQFTKLSKEEIENL